VDHGALSGLADDDHAGYLLLAGRSGTGNNALLSTSADGQIIGSGIAAGNLDLRASNQTDYTGAVTVGKGAGDYGTTSAYALKIWPDGLRIGLTGLAAGVAFTGTLVQDTDTLFGLPSIQLLFGGYTHENVAGCTGIATSTPFYGAITQRNVTAVNSTGAVVSYVSTPVVTRTAAGTMTATEESSYSSAIRVDNATATLARDFAARTGSIAGGGAITTHIGLDIETLVGTTPVSIRSSGAAIDARHAGGVRLGLSTAGADTLLHLTGTASRVAAITLDEESNTPANPTADSQMRMYCRANKVIFQWLDGATARYKYLDLTGTGVTWVHTTTAPT